MSDSKHVVLGVSGSIAAHKAIDLASLLTKAHCTVDVVMTRGALQFVKPLPFQTLTRRRVITDLFDEMETDVTHIQAADAADLLLLAPATANTLAKMACGLSDDALSCVALALRPKARVLVAPAMNGRMWEHPATVSNVTILKNRGMEFIGPDKGMLSCGYDGIGRLWPVAEIAEHVMSVFGMNSANP